MHFSELSLCPAILRALQEEGYTTPTPIQREAIPHVLEGRDLLGCAQTGTGKTAAFALPVLHMLATAPRDMARRGPRPVRALVLSPTRELAAQIGESFAAYGRELSLTGAVIYGGVSQYHQEKALRRGVDIVVATPGRLIDLLEQGVIDLSEVEVLVLDEADRMLDMGFIQPIRRIAAATPPPPDRQTLLFSATMPKAIAELAASLLRQPVRVTVAPSGTTAAKIEQSVFMVSRRAKQSLLRHMLADEAVERAVVFARTKHGAERIGEKLVRAGIEAETIHGDKAQSQRKKALAKFSDGRARVLVATDVAARGLDVDGITHVVNFDLPVEAEAYVHRIGRTGRAGAAGVAVSFCDAEERRLLREIEKLTGFKIPVRELPADLGPAMPEAPRNAEERPAADRARPRPAQPVRRAKPQGRPEQRTPENLPGGEDRPRSRPGPSRKALRPWQKKRGGRRPVRN